MELSYIAPFGADNLPSQKAPVLRYASRRRLEIDAVIKIEQTQPGSDAKLSSLDPASRRNLDRLRLLPKPHPQPPRNRSHFFFT